MPKHSFARHYHLLRGMRPSYQVAVQRPGAEPEMITLTGVPAASPSRMTATPTNPSAPGTSSQKLGRNVTIEGGPLKAKRMALVKKRFSH